MLGRVTVSRFARSVGRLVVGGNVLLAVIVVVVVIINIISRFGNDSNLDFRTFVPFQQQTGNIPTFIGGLSTLVRLYLSNNRLSGTIPRELSDRNLVDLEEIYLHGNNLSGTVPASLADLPSLSVLFIDGTCVCVDDQPTNECFVESFVRTDLARSLRDDQVPLHLHLIKPISLSHTHTHHCYLPHLVAFIMILSAHRKQIYRNSPR